MALHQQREFDDFDLYNVQIMSYLMTRDNGHIDDEIVELLDKLKNQQALLKDKIVFLEEKVNIDGKTGLLKYSDNYLERIIKSAARTLENHSNQIYHVSYIRLDIDNFSLFNNQYGHDLGDDVLRMVADCVRTCSRPTDFCIRFGGEEFDILLPTTPVIGAVKFLDKLLNNIRSLEIPWEDQFLKVTVSGGISVYSAEISQLKKLDKSMISVKYKQLQREVDDCLYEAKHQGKDRFCIFDSSRLEDYKRMRREYVERSKGLSA